MKNYFTSLISVVLMLAILAPSVIKITHALYEHQELICENDDYNSDHVHKTELDCEFQKFNLSPQQYSNFVNIQKVEIPLIKENDWNHYIFLSNYQKLHFDLRGPPIS